MAGRPLNPTAASLLGFLHHRPMSGWDLLTTARAVIGNFWTLTQSQVYRELAQLARDGLVEAGAPGARERRPYTLTEAGRAAFADWLRKPPGTEQIRYPLLLTVSFGRHLPADQLAEFIAAHRADHAARLAAYRAQRSAADQAAGQEGGGADPYAAATLDFGIRYEIAVLEWIDHLPPPLAGTGDRG